LGEGRGPLPPPVRYTRSGEVSIAYQVVGDGPIDLILVPGFVSDVELAWEEPSLANFYGRLASFGRLILFDKRGTGLSDRVAGVPTLEERMDDVRAVMDAAGCDRAAIFGVSEGGPMSLLFGATYPRRIAAIVVYGSYARTLRAPDYPWGEERGSRAARAAKVERTWPLALAESLAPSRVGDQRFESWLITYLRHGASPAAAAALYRMNQEIDVRAALPAIRVPCLILHRTDDSLTPVGHGRYLSDKIPGAKFVELNGKDHLPFVGDGDAIVDEIQEFLTGLRPGPEPSRVLATVLFTDIVDSTRRAAELGDHAWRDVLSSYYELVRRTLGRFQGRELDTAGDGFLASFDGPARAIRCACSITEEMARLGIAVRAGLHTGECEVTDDHLIGIAVHVGARVAALAGPGEVLVSSTVRDLVAGSGIVFTGRGAHVLKGLPGRRPLFAAVRP